MFFLINKITVEDIIEKYFGEPTVFGNRYCKLFNDYRINKKGELEYDCTGWGDSYWIICTWKYFNEALENNKKNKEEKEYLHSIFKKIILDSRNIQKEK